MPKNPLDSVPFVLDKKWFKKRGENIDLGQFQVLPPTAAPGVNPEDDVKEITWDDVTGGE